MEEETIPRPYGMGLAYAITELRDGDRCIRRNTVSADSLADKNDDSAG